MGSGEAGGNAWFSLCPDIVNVLRLLRLVACALATYDEALALGKQRKVGMRIGHLVFVYSVLRAALGGRKEIAIARQMCFDRFFICFMISDVFHGFLTYSYGST